MDELQGPLLAWYARLMFVIDYYNNGEYDKAREILSVFERRFERDGLGND